MGLRQVDQLQKLDELNNYQSRENYTHSPKAKTWNFLLYYGWLIKQQHKHSRLFQKFWGFKKKYVFGVMRPVTMRNITQSRDDSCMCVTSSIQMKELSYTHTHTCVFVISLYTLSLYYTFIAMRVSARLTVVGTRSTDDVHLNSTSSSVLGWGPWLTDIYILWGGGFGDIIIQFISVRFRGFLCFKRDERYRGPQSDLLTLLHL